MNERLYCVRQRWLYVGLNPTKNGGMIWECTKWWDGRIEYRLIADCPSDDALYSAKRLLEGA